MRIVFCLFVIFLTAGCNKEQMQRDAVVSAMTSGQWKVVRFISAGTDVTADFADIKFQFKENQTVDALRNNTVDKTGNWNADATARTITSSFVNGGYPLTMLNGTWKITNNSWTFVEANLTINSETRQLRLEKL